MCSGAVSLRVSRPCYSSGTPLVKRSNDRATLGVSGPCRSDGTATLHVAPKCKVLHLTKRGYRYNPRRDYKTQAMRCNIYARPSHVVPTGFRRGVKRVCTVLATTRYSTLSKCTRQAAREQLLQQFASAKFSRLYLSGTPRARVCVLRPQD